VKDLTIPLHGEEDSPKGPNRERIKQLAWRSSKKKRGGGEMKYQRALVEEDLGESYSKVYWKGRPGTPMLSTKKESGGSGRRKKRIRSKKPMT